MKKNILLPIINLSLLFGSLRVSAQSDDLVAPLKDDLGAPVKDISDIANLFLNVAKWIYTFVFIVSIIMILVSAYYFITNRGDSNRIEKAKKQLKWAIVGIVVALTSAVIALVVKNFLGGGGPPPNDVGPNFPAA